MALHGHGHGHGHGHHDHGPGGHHAHAGRTADSDARAADNARRVLWALLVTASFMVAEVVGGILSGSLALLADAGHMLTDAAALAFSWYAFRVSRRPSTPKHSYGLHRVQVLAAFINGAALIGITVWIAVEAVHRLLAPVPVLGGPMLVIALLGMLVNVVAFAILHGGDRANLNMRGAALHVLGDLLGSAAAAGAAVVIMLTGWTPIDPILSILVGALIARGAWSLMRRSWHVLMEGAPDGVDVDELRQTLTRAVPSVLDVHHVHLWSVTPERPLITLHATIAAGADHDVVLHALQDVLAERYDLDHATIQLETQPCPGHVSSTCGGTDAVRPAMAGGGGH